ncbi:hypothetical protein PPL_09741 [Heterostelium album PN500]|uniref:Uncharacterized protein n=1 Tax=Heterostelium pallidum (strain ATCC 26659 / Pp 5 / PN500) TaxID=670386 RepID=D3BNN8_HETP5|nr:hypothetical protein PPL_09741 [Heterostelium album PN500]EFA76989.1 hypothetical protein PPL_09741 [Heterostelium album PN500]|eukprot:XP_020429120.1 hypothetical protein PPL_09741 [Heterostelium album PN500]
MFKVNENHNNIWRYSYPICSSNQSNNNNNNNDISSWKDGMINNNINNNNNNNSFNYISQKRSMTENSIDINNNNSNSSSSNNKKNNNSVNNSFNSLNNYFQEEEREDSDSWSFYCNEEYTCISAPSNSFGNLTEFDLSAILEPRPVKSTSRIHELLKGKIRERIGRLLNNEEMRKEGKAIEKGATDYELNLSKAHERAKKQIQQTNNNNNNNNNSINNTNSTDTNWNSIVPITIFR